MDQLDCLKRKLSSCNRTSWLQTFAHCFHAVQGSPTTNNCDPKPHPGGYSRPDPLTFAHG